MYQKFLKRPLDFVLSLMGIVVLSPVLILTAVMVRIILGKPIVFKQKRPGLNEKIFMLYKFRTMTDKRDASGQLLPDEIRLTKFGKFLRSTSLDELPELFNILKGDMSLIGPRPLLVQYLPLYNDIQRLRHKVRPGLTGLAQINGRNAISWNEKFQFDLQYIEKITFFNDFKILILTVIKVFRKEGINSELAVTMEAFYGNEEEKKEK